MKSIIFGDIHFGEKNNSQVFNQDCIEYLTFLCDYGKENGIKKCIFLGDWFHSRNAINVSTLTYAIEGVRMLSRTFDEVVFILGNHDLYYRQSLDTHSLEFLKEFPNIKLIDKISVDGDSVYVPWLVGNMFDELIKIDAKYIYGHFELPGFLLNAMSVMPDTGKVDISKFRAEYLFSGHFHKRQMQRNSSGCEIHYVGSAFPHNFADSNDRLRGFCVHEEGEEPFYVNWDELPYYCSMPLSSLLEAPEEFINEKTYLKTLVDLNISEEESIFIREVFRDIFQARDISYTRRSNDVLTLDEDIDTIDFETLDEIVIHGLGNIESNTLDKNKLIEIYRTL